MAAFTDSQGARWRARLRLLAGRTLVILRRFGVVLVIIAVITWVCARLSVNATTAGFAYLLAVLSLATVWGLREALSASLLAVFCFNFFFFPPIGTFHVADPHNWVALSAFLVTAIIASQLSAHAKQRTQEAVTQRLEMERLYALSRAILLTDPKQDAAPQIAQQIAQIFDCRAVALYDRQAGVVHGAGPADMPALADPLQQAAREGTVPAGGPSSITVAAIRLGASRLEAWRSRARRCRRGAASFGEPGGHRPRKGTQPAGSHPGGGRPAKRGTQVHLLDAIAQRSRRR